MGETEQKTGWKRKEGAIEKSNRRLRDGFFLESACSWFYPPRKRVEVIFCSKDSSLNRSDKCDV